MFTNKHLNVDQMTRFMVLHYFTPWYYLYLIQLHILFCHESWDADSGETTYEDKSGSYVSWFYDAFLKEIQDAWYWVIAAAVLFWLHHFTPLALNFFFFEKWNFVEFDEIRFYGVAPHWYFRPYMGLLVISPTHYEGLMWVGLYFAALTFLPFLYTLYNGYTAYAPSLTARTSLLQTATFLGFVLSIFCIASILPCGRYYYEPEGGYLGHPWIKWSVQYSYLYLLWLIHHLDVIEGFLIRTLIHIRRRLHAERRRRSRRRTPAPWILEYR